MRELFVVLLSFSTAAQAHESIVSHTHPHGVSVLAGIDTIACGLLVLGAALLAYWQFSRGSAVRRDRNGAREIAERKATVRDMPLSGEKR